MVRIHFSHATARHNSPARLSLCMIVRDNAQTLTPCLASIRPWVDEMVVVDTGSKDETPHIASRMGARVFHFPWCDDFSAARNESLRHAQGQWLFWMDSDDTINEECGRQLRQLAYAEHSPEILGFVMQVHCPYGPREGRGDGGVTIVDHVKMFRNHPEIRFEFCIHEQILPAINRLEGRTAWTDIYVTHSHSDQTPEGRERKYERDIRILRKELEERPDHPFALFNLGMTYNDMGKHEKACEALRRCLEVSQPHESHVRKAYAFLVSSLAELNRLDEALAICRTGRNFYDQDTELLFRQALVAHRMGRIEEAEQCYLQAIHQTEGRHYSSIDAGLSGHRARHNLAVVYRDMGLIALEELQWRRLLTEQADYRPGFLGLVRSLLAQKKQIAAETELDRLERYHPGDKDVAILRGELAETNGDYQKARAIFEDAVEQSPERIEAWDALCRFLFDRGSPAEAEAGLKRWMSRHPDCDAPRRNLAVLRARATGLSLPS